MKHIRYQPIWGLMGLLIMTIISSPAWATTNQHIKSSVQKKANNAVTRINYQLPKPVKLTAYQKQTIHNIVRKHQKQLFPLKRQLVNNNKQLRLLHLNKGQNKKKSKLYQQRQSIQRSIQQVRYSQQQSINRVLSKQQRHYLAVQQIKHQRKYRRS